MNLWWHCKRWFQPEVGRVNLDPNRLISLDRQQKIEELMSSVGFSKPDRILPLRSTNNEVYELQYDHQFLVLKIDLNDTDSSLLYEDAVLRFLKKERLPHPGVLRSGSTEEPKLTWLLMNQEGYAMHFYRWIIPLLLYESGKLLANYHSVRFDENQQEEGGLTAGIRIDRLLPFDSWSNDLSKLIEQRVIAPGSAETILRELKRVTEPPGRSLCHGEFTLPHILVKKKRVNCAIDWPSACWSCPASDLAISEVYLRSIQYPFRYFLKGYRTMLSIDDYLAHRQKYMILAVIKRLRTSARVDQNHRFLKVMDQIIDGKYQP